METLLKVDQARKEVVATRNNIHTYRRTATEEELKEARKKELDKMGSDYN